MNAGLSLPSALFDGTGYDPVNHDMPKDMLERHKLGAINISGMAGLNAALG